MAVLYAHRGAAVELPENTLPAFRRALDLGADALEMDAHLTRDRVVVISHDPTGERMAGVPTRICRADLAEVKSWNMGVGFTGRPTSTPLGRYEIPTLDEVLEEFPDTLINVDLKQRAPSMVGDLLAVVDRHQAADRVQLASFHAKTLLAIRRRGYRGKTALSPPEVVFALTTPANVFRHLPLRGDLAQIPTRTDFLHHYRLGPFASLAPGNAWMLRQLRRRGLRVDFWTVNDADEALRLVHAGADGIMTDDPRLIAAVLGKAPPSTANPEHLPTTAS